MDPLRAPNKNWILTRAAFDNLLAHLDDDRNRAGEKYEKIRHKLMNFFKWRGCALPEFYADRTLDRVARRVTDGAELRVRDPYLHCHGVALNVLREYWRESEAGAHGLEDLPQSRTPSENPEESMEGLEQTVKQDRRLNCLDRCTQKLPPASLALIADYHQGAGLNKQRRMEMAARLGIAMNALRIKAHRIRSELENCINECLTNP